MRKYILFPAMGLVFGTLFLAAEGKASQSESDQEIEMSKRAQYEYIGNFEFVNLIPDIEVSVKKIKSSQNGKILSSNQEQFNSKQAKLLKLKFYEDLPRISQNERSVVDSIVFTVKFKDSDYQEDTVFSWYLEDGCLHSNTLSGFFKIKGCSKDVFQPKTSYEGHEVDEYRMQYFFDM